MSNNNHPSDTCDNCKRQLHENNDISDIYVLNSSLQDGKNIRSRKFKDSEVRTAEDRHYTLCNECNTYLTSTNDKIRYDSKYIWPAFIWSILKDVKIHECYGNSIWRLIPSSWRQWWLNSVKNYFPMIFSDISLENPSPLFHDATKDIKEWNDNIDPYLLF